VVDVEVEVVRLEIGFMGASTLGMVYSTEVVGKHIVEMIDWQVVNGIEVKNTRDKVWTMKDE